MIVLAKLILITFIWVMGVKISTSEDMIFEKLGKWGEMKVKEGHKIYEALIVCPWCLPSFHSIIAHGFAFGLGILPLEFNWQLLIRWPLVIMGASFLSGNAWNIYETINRIKERNEQEAIYFKILNNENINEQPTGDS